LSSDHERRVREFLAQKQREDPKRYQDLKARTPVKAATTLDGLARREVGAASAHESVLGGRGLLESRVRYPTEQRRWRVPDDEGDYEPDWRDLKAGYYGDDAEEDEAEGPLATLHEGQWVYVSYEFNSRGDICGITRVPAPAPPAPPSNPRLLTVDEDLDERIRRDRQHQERWEWQQTEQGRVWKLHRDGFSYRQIAEQTGKSIGTVKATLNQARRTRAGWGV
jgi:DNA-binding CsgD family transcriptional regulator